MDGLNPGKPESWSTFLSLLLSAMLAFAVTFTSPYRASNLTICTDSVEYAVGAWNIADSGKFFIRVNGEELPSRYPPWFSLIALTPGYLILGPETGNAIIPITVFSLIAVIAAFLIGRRLHHTWGGFMSAAILLLLPAYRAYSHHVMTEVPCAALALVSVLLYIDMRASPTPDLRKFAMAGFVTGLAAAFRPACAAFILPFAILSLRNVPSPKLFLPRIVTLSFPLLTVTGLTMAYNSAVFGSAGTNGYDFWCPELFSSFHTLFSISFMKANLRELLLSGLPMLAIAAACLWFANTRRNGGVSSEKTETALSAAIYLVLGTGPIMLLHIFYQWYDQRFFLPLLAILCPITGGLAANLIGRTNIRILLAAQALILAIAIAARMTASPIVPERRNAAERIIRHTPPNALVISSIDPVYLEHLTCRDSQRRILPMSRSVDYTSTSINTGKLPGKRTGPKPGGLYPYTASERMDKVSDELHKNTPVFLDTSQVLAGDVATVNRLAQFFTLLEAGDRLYELQIKP